ncbi:Rv3235 family protein [Streptomyces sp. NPDC088254]|uniref:Rv3235 family protein n=1 Tax=Streptomyces sp. NPDC088254 TaxID=3365847 RepID=UPI0037F3CFB5
MHKVMTRKPRTPGGRPPGRRDTRRPAGAPPRTPSGGAPRTTPGDGRPPGSPGTSRRGGAGPADNRPATAPGPGRPAPATARTTPHPGLDSTAPGSVATTATGGRTGSTTVPHPAGPTTKPGRPDSATVPARPATVPEQTPRRPFVPPQPRPTDLFADRLLAVLSGRRPVHCMLRHTVGRAYDDLAHLAEHGPLRTPHGVSPVVRDIGYYVARPGAIEAFARIGAGDRLRAMAFRLELGADHRWRCTAVEIDGPRRPRPADD